MAWAIYETPKSIHIAPEDDIQEHKFMEPCWCRVYVDRDNDNIIHRAFLPLGTAYEEGATENPEPLTIRQ